MRAQGAIGAQLDRPDPRVRFYLFHGPDESGSRALARRLLKGLGADRQVLAGAELKDDAGGLVALASSASLFGDVSIAWVEPLGDDGLEAVERLLDSEVERPAIGIAGALRKTSKLLKLVEGHPHGLAKANYPLEGRDLVAHIVGAGRERGLRIDEGLAGDIGEACAANQGLVANELDKFALYLSASPEDPRTLNPETVEQLGAETGSADVFQLGDLAVAGRMDELAEALSDGRLGGNEIMLVRSLQRRLLQLAPLRAKMENGQSAQGVVQAAVPPIFFRDKPIVIAALQRWTAGQIATAVDRLADLEKQLMLRGAPGESTTGETLAAFARVAARARR